ncbi:response regulator transcription factor [Marixanthomonas spongiae]|uniref:response regulator transcription factor n=1 Tax=Marixanthomonas spongiae TaxID=2174845 RepID=UPI001F0C3F20|nr:LuxR C-terminal-related transcriptional regulator [Marixanthomonas spongiae]
MNTYKKITELLKKAKKNSLQLNNNETIAVLDALKQISESKRIIDKAIYYSLILEQKSPKIKNLSPREIQIFTLVGNGLRSKEIAAMLSISQQTVGTHRKNIIKKLKIKGSRQLQSLAYKYNNSESKKAFLTKNTQ